MSSLLSPLAYPSDPPSPIRASELRRRLSEPDSDLSSRLIHSYGEHDRLIRDRLTAAGLAVDRFLEVFGDRRCGLFRAPARLSLNPHCDHQGAWVPYGLHSRELLTVASSTEDGAFQIANVDAAFTPKLAFRVEDEIDRDRAAWDEGWFRYIEAPAVVEEVRANLDPKAQRQNRRSTVNYVKSSALRLRHLFPGRALPGLDMVLNGNISQGGGQSSSSALGVTTALALSQFSDLPLDRRELAERCGEAEWFVGTRGGSGDQAAILLGSREGLTHLCFEAPFGVRGVRFSRFPAEFRLIVANSQTRSEKSAEERLLFNRGIFAYRFAFLALKEAMRALDLPASLIEETHCLGDLHTGRVAEADLYRLLRCLPEAITPAELSVRFPQAFGPATRGCFGTDDPSLLPSDIPLRGAAMFGLARVDRGRVMPDLLERGDADAMAEFGRLLSITHDGDRLFLNGAPYTLNRERLSDAAVGRALADVEAGLARPLRNEPGFYAASIGELDRMVDVVQRVDGVLGAGLMGAGGGGYVLILARQGSFGRVRDALVSEYYAPLDKEPDVESWRPTAAACRLL